MLHIQLNILPTDEQKIFSEVKTKLAPIVTNSPCVVCFVYMRTQTFLAANWIRKNDVSISRTINDYQETFIHTCSRTENTALMLFEIKLLCHAARKLCCCAERRNSSRDFVSIIHNKSRCGIIDKCWLSVWHYRHQYLRVVLTISSWHLL